MAFDFPAAPTNGTEFTPPGGPTYVYQAPVWMVKGSSTSGLTISDTPPANPAHEDQWWESDTGSMFVYYQDADSGQWVQTNVGGGGSGAAGEPPITAGLITDYWRGDKTWQPRATWADQRMQWASAATEVGLQFNTPDLSFGAGSAPVRHWYWGKTAAGPTAGAASAMKLFPNNPDVVLSVTSEDAGATASPKIILDRASPSPSSSDLIGALEMNGRNLGGTARTYVYITGQIINPTIGAEDGALLINVMTGGSPQELLKINGQTSYVETINFYASANLTVGHNRVVGVNGTPGSSFSADGSAFFECNTAALNVNKLGGNGSVQSFEQGPGAVCGSISVANATTTAYNTTSDARLKEDPQPFDSGSIIDAISVYDFKWIASGIRAHGVIAQEAVEVYPEAIIYEEDKDWWGVDYSKYVPLLLNEIKALRARVAALEGAA